MKTAPLPHREKSWRASFGIIAAWVALCLIWGSTWLAIKIGLADLPPISFTALRFVIAAAVLFAISLGRFPLPAREDYPLLAITGILMFTINYALLFWASNMFRPASRLCCRRPFQASDSSSPIFICRRSA